MENIFWLVADRLAGRCGPDQAPWDLAALRKNGIDTILSLAAGLYDSSEVTAAGMDHACFPLPNNVPPLPADDEDMMAGCLQIPGCLVDTHHQRAGGIQELAASALQTATLPVADAMGGDQDPLGVR